MDDRVDHGLEDRPVAVLGELFAAGSLHRCDEHVAQDEGDAVPDLAVQRPAEPLGVNLMVGVLEGAAIPDRFDIGAGEPGVRPPGAEERSGDRRPLGSEIVRGQELHLAQDRLRVFRALWEKALPQLGRQVAERGLRDGLLLEADDAGLAALLKQPGEEVRGQLAFRAAQAPEVPSGALMHEEALWHVDLDDGTKLAGLIRQLHPDDLHRQGRNDAVVADLADIALHGVELLQRDAFDLAGLVVDSEDADPVRGVGHGGELVREVVPLRSDDLLASEAHRLELEDGVLSQPDFAQQVFGVIEHSSLASRLQVQLPISGRSRSTRRQSPSISRSAS